MNKEILKKLYTDNSLLKSDVHTDKRGFTIITKSGIEKIKFNHNIFVDYEPIRCDKDFVVFKATSYINEEAKENIGTRRAIAAAGGVRQKTYSGYDLGRNVSAQMGGLRMGVPRYGYAA